MSDSEKNYPSKKKLSRREFLRLAGLSAGVATLPLGKDSEQEKDPDWEEITPLEEGGAKYLGSVKERFGNDRTNEVRAYELPKNPELPGSRMIALCSRNYLDEDPDDKNANVWYRGMRILVLPDKSDRKEDTPEKYDRTLSFEGLTLDLVQEGSDRTNIWEADFYLDGARIACYNNTNFETTVRHTGESEVYGNRMVFFSKENMHLLTEDGVVTKEVKSMVFETESGGWSSVPLPEKLSKPDLDDVTVVKMGSLVLIDGLGEKPFSYVCAPEIGDEQDWHIVSRSNDEMILSSTSEFLGEIHENQLGIEIDPENMKYILTAIAALERTWRYPGRWVSTERKDPNYANVTRETIFGSEIREPDFNSEFILTGIDPATGETRTSKIAINHRKVNPVPLQKYKPDLNA